MADDAKMRQLDQLEEGQEPVEAKASPKVSYERTRNRLKPVFPDRKWLGISENSALERKRGVSFK